jgi:hypothetical protein
MFTFPNRTQGINLNFRHFRFSDKVIYNKQQKKINIPKFNSRTGKQKNDQQR